ncbi:MAG TPA: FAD:protein FMN transferase [Vicinamibacterales bacterium]|nr:FAD:protein FMN transferase [Vicinamibacterales bacterium]
MACRFEVVLPDADASSIGVARAVLDEADRVEAALSVFRADSAIAALNRGAAYGPLPVDGQLFRLLELCRELHARTGGLFDITSTPLSRCWGFLRRNGQVPGPQAIAEARECVGMDRVELDAIACSVGFRRAGVELNLGAIGKGYALDRMGDQLRRQGVAHALLSAGGSSVLAVGGGAAGWHVDIASRLTTRRRIASLRLRGASLGSSGAGEQYVDVNGVRYGHVLDPRTGWPAAGVLSASVVSDRAALADALSTAFLVGGVDIAARYCAAHPRTLALIIPDDTNQHALMFGEHPGATLEGA